MNCVMCSNIPCAALWPYCILWPYCFSLYTCIFIDSGTFSSTWLAFSCIAIVVILICIILCPLTHRDKRSFQALPTFSWLKSIGYCNINIDNCSKQNSSTHTQSQDLTHSQHNYLLQWKQSLIMPFWNKQLFFNLLLFVWVKATCGLIALICFNPLSV